MESRPVSLLHFRGSLKRIPIFKKRKPPSLPLELWIEITFYIYISAGSFASLSRVSKALRACCISRLFTSIYMKPTRSKDTVKQLSESPSILDVVQKVYFRPAPRMWLPRFNKSPPLYDEFVGVMWRMPNLTGLYVHGIDDLPASLVDLMMHNKTLEQLGLSNVKIPQLACHLQTTSLSYRSIEANSVTGDVELLFSNSSSTLQRLEIGSQFPIRVISTLSHSPTNGMSSLVELTIWKSLTEEQARWFVRLLPCCPILGTLSIHGKFPSPMSAIPPQALPRLHSLRADEDGHALVLLGNPIRRVYALTLTLEGPSMFHLLQGVHSRPTSISGEIAHACLTTPNDDFHRLVQDCERFHNVFVSLTDFATQIAPTARLLTLMPSLEHISIIFLLPSYSNFKSMAKSLKEPRAIEIIQHWLKEADQFCSLLQRLSIKVDVAGNHIWFDCVRRKQDQSKKWGVRIWREYDISTYIDSDITQRAKSWVANIEI